MSRFTKIQIARLDEIASRTPTVPAFPDDTPQKKLERLERAKGNDWKTFKWVMQTYFPHICTKPFCKAHEDMTNKILFYAWALRVLSGARTLAKTTMFAIMFVIWKFMQGYQYNVQASADKELSEARTKFIYNELKNNVRLRCDYPRLVPEGDDQAGYHLRNGSLVEAVSIKMAVKGRINPRTAKRPDLIILDDIDIAENQGNPAIGKRKLDKITGEIAGAVNPDYIKKPPFVIWLGNLTHPNFAICQFAKQLEDEAQDQPTCREGNHILTRERVLLRYPLEDKDGNSIWEEQFPTAELPSVRKLMGSVEYQRQMLGKAVIEGNIFKESWFKHYAIQMRIADFESRIKQVVLITDPARGTKGAFKAIGAIAYDGNNYYLLRCWVRQTERSAYFQRLYDDYKLLTRTYGYKLKAYFETVFGQADILDDFDRWAQENGKEPISHFFKHLNTKDNKAARIESLETVIESGKVLFCQGQDFETLKMQFLNYPEGYMDGPDMVAMGMQRFPSFSARNRVKVRRFSYS